jgi:uncharacterized protein (DUF2062 family)/precorrin-6B methylase 2
VSETGSALRARLRTAWRRLRGGALSPWRAAASIAVGLFVGCTPLYGVHSLIVLAICIPLRLDAAIAYLAAHISNPFTFPFVFGIEVEVGSFLLTGHGTELSLSAAKDLGLMKVGARLVLGAAVVAPATGLLGAAITWVLSLRLQDAREPARAEARKRTLARYSRARLAVRTYVRSKLLIDPILESITALIGSFGRIVDAGSGFGHIGLSLLDRGRANSLVGIDSDPRRIEVARAAGGRAARFELEDISRAEFPEADTILFIDCLHYLPAATQDALLARSAAALAPGGRLIVREVASGTSFRGRLTEWLERRAARRRGYHVTLNFRTMLDLVRVMEEQGLSCSAAGFENLGVLDSAFIVGKKPRAPAP